MTDSWTDRFVEAIPDEIAQRRADVMWREMAPNGLDLLIGGLVSDLGGARSMLSITTPDEWKSAADLIQMILDREPLKSRSRYAGERIILGSLASELRSYAIAAERG